MIFGLNRVLLMDKRIFRVLIREVIIIELFFKSDKWLIISNPLQSNWSSRYILT